MSDILPGDLISAKSAAHLIAVHISTIYRYIHTGRLRSYWIAGTRHRVRRADVEGLLVLVNPREEVPTMQAVSREHEKAMEELRARGLRI
jgi:excisionase family DNA binding protein